MEYVTGVWTSYDAEADVLYVNFRQPSEADDAELGDDNVIRRYAADGELIGVTVLNASTRTASSYYDRETDSLYIELTPEPGVDTVEVADGVVADLDEQGKAVGIDIDRASERLDRAILEMFDSWAERRA